MNELIEETGQNCYTSMEYGRGREIGCRRNNGKKKDGRRWSTCSVASMAIDVRDDSDVKGFPPSLSVTVYGLQLASYISEGTRPINYIVRDVISS